MSSTPSRMQLLLMAVVLLVCSSVGPLSAANAIEAFPDSANRGTTVGQVIAPQVDDVTPRSFTGTKAAKSNLRSEASGAGSASSDVPATVLPGENGFGHVSYNSNSQATPSASDSSSTLVESQAAYRARIRKAEREAELKYPHLRLQNLISFAAPGALHDAPAAALRGCAPAGAPQATYVYATGSDHTNAEKWLDEGFETSATLSDWEAQETLCFYENATLRIRLDPLNSTLQPYVVRAFGQSKEAHEIYDFLVDKMSKLQEFAWPFRSFFWVWSDLRVVVKSPHYEELNFKFTRYVREIGADISAGMLCRGMMLADQSAPMLIEYIPDYAVEYLQIALRFLSTHLCETCVHGCARECIPLGNDACMVVLSPYHAPCVTVSAPSKPFLSSSAPTLPFSLAFQTVLSSLFIQNFFLGLFLFYSSERLSRSRTFHYFLGASIGICFSAMLALYFFTRQTRAAAKMVPGAQFIQSVGSLVSFAVPFTSFVLMPSIYKLVSWGLSYLAYIWSCEELLGIPHLGKIYFFFFGFLGFVLVWWNQWGASPKSETKQDQDEIDELGYLDEDLPLTTSQMALSRFLKLVGVALLFYSTSSTEISLVLVLLVSLTRLFQFLGTTFYFWYHFERAGRHSVLISKKEFEKQAVSETEKALKQLQDFLQKNPDELDKVNEENEIRLRRFMKGRNHMDVATRDSALSARQRAQKSMWSYCSIQ